MGAVSGFGHLSLVQLKAATPTEARFVSVAELEAEYLAEIRALRLREGFHVVGKAARSVRLLPSVESPHAC
jgi:hypothetical protein